MKVRKSKSAWLLAAGAIFALSVTILNSCSSDEDYGMYMGDELRTHAAATRSAAPEPGSSGGSAYSFLTTLKRDCGTGGCGVWCVGYLMSDQTNTGENNLLNKATELNSDWKSSGLDATQLISLAQYVNVNLTSFISSQYKVGEDVFTDRNRVSNKIRALAADGNFTNKIVAVDGHWVVALRLNANSVSCVDVNQQDFDQRVSRSLSSVTQLIY